ncbi:MAG TPA: M28 family metallopeptidase [Gemmatimonadaceae bacterium]|nr:M28 family metallopeptidase [Gemmatimonadaceae bacterium]
MRAALRYLLIPPLLIVFGAAAPHAPRPLEGFSPAAARAELDWEAKFRAIPQPDTMRRTMHLLGARPHHVGSPYDKQNAEWILAQYKRWGFDAHIENFQVLFPTPTLRVLEMVAPTHYVAKLREPPVPGDSTSYQGKEQLPPYNAYSPDGDVTGRLVYVNYGLPEDYEELARLGVSVKGAIVIVRYGRSWRGVKPKLAAKHGAIGCIIYSDPADDGYAEGDVYPKGPMRPPQGVQRGSVMQVTLYGGDPLTPGIGAVKGAKRLPLSQAKTIAPIPTLPIGYGDAKPLLAALGGPVAPGDWRGALPITYHVGAGPARVHLHVKFDWSLKPLYDVIAKIPGSSAPDQWVIRGNHHDAWVNGASDPLSGQVAMLEEARAFGTLLKEGWRPRRTIIYCAWDGEEPMLLGSTEWAEEHADELRQHAVVYINSDNIGRGYLNMSGSHTLQHFINGVARDIPDPETHVSVWKRDWARRVGRARPGAQRRMPLDNGDLAIGALGTGSDYTPFLQHLGIATLNLGYGGEDRGGVYHSAYDDFYWYTHFSDTSFVYGRALAQTAGTAIMRLADAQLLPFDFTPLAQTVSRYTSQVKQELDQERQAAQTQNREIAEGVFADINDPRAPTVAPDSEAIPPALDFSPLDQAVAALTQSAARYDQARDALHADGDSSIVHIATDGVNALLLRSERDLTDPKGLPGRPWYIHLLYAPGVFTGYGAKTMPGVREAVEQQQWALARQEIGRTAAALRAEAALVDSATTMLR